jgi:hypothetical protein
MLTQPEYSFEICIRIRNYEINQASGCSSTDMSFDFLMLIYYLPDNGSRYYRHRQGFPHT